MPSDSRRRDPRRKKKAVDSDGESGAEDELRAQPHPSHLPKKSPKPPHGNIIIKGDVHIKSVKGDFNLIQGGRDEARTQRSATPTRNQSRRLQPSRAMKRGTAQCDSPTASDDDVTTGSDYSELEYVTPKRPARPTNPPERLRLHSERKKRDQADEGYHTSGTVSYTAQVSGKVKGKERSVSSVGSSSSQPRLSSSSGSRFSKGKESETDASSCHSERDDEDEIALEQEDQPEYNANQEDEEASDDDFLKLPIHIGNPSAQDIPAIGEKAILDTGTKVDWISQMFYDKLRDMGVRSTKLSSEEKEMQYRDFNGKKFQPTGKVDLMIQTEEFKGQMKCRTMKFFVASKATFWILFGRDTIRKHGFFTRSKRDTDGEGVLIGVHDELTDAQKAEAKRKREEQKKIAHDRKKMREAKAEEAVRRKDTANVSSSKVAAHLATTVSRPSKTRSPPKDSPRQSSSSMEGTW